MPRVGRFISIVLLGAAIGAPAAVVASAAPQDHRDDNRVYDKDHKDYHNWDDHEDKAYRSYLKEQHKGYRDFKKLNDRDQSAYWNWRHEHPDHD
jgi:hypothetical protein